MQFRTLPLVLRLAIVLGVTVAPLLAVTVFNEIQLRRDREREIHDLAQKWGQLASLEMQRVVDGIEATLRAIAQSPTVKNRDLDACNQYLAGFKWQVPHLVALTVVSLDGTILCRSAATSATRISNLQFLEEAKAANGFVVGRYGLAQIAGVKALPVALPVFDATNTKVALLMSALDLDWLDAKLRERDFAKNSALTIADRDGFILARQPFPERFVGTRIPEAFRHLLQAPEPGTLEVMSQDGSRRVIGYFPTTVGPHGIYISAGVSPDEAFQSINAATWRTVLITIASLVVAVLAGWLTNRTFVTRPVSHIVSTLKAWRSGDESARTGMRAGASEFAQVGSAIDGFMDELAERRRLSMQSDRLQKLLMHELQHRVKNTLATVQALAAQTFRGGGNERRAELESFAQRLRAIGEAHHVLMQGHWQSADITEIVTTTLAPFRIGSADQIVVKGPPLQLRSKATLALSMALHEMATNATKYGALSTRTGRITIDWSLGEGPNAIFRLRWLEQSDVPVRAPTRTGFGTRMIQQVLAAELQAHVDILYEPGGVQYLLETPAHALIDDPGIEAQASSAATG